MRNMKKESSIRGWKEVLNLDLDEILEKIRVPKNEFQGLLCEGSLSVEEFFDEISKVLNKKGQILEKEVDKTNLTEADKLFLRYLVKRFGPFYVEKVPQCNKFNYDFWMVLFFVQEKIYLKISGFFNDFEIKEVKPQKVQTVEYVEV